MDISLFSKLGNIFGYIFSSFIPVGLLVIFGLLLALLILNLKYENKTFNVVIIGIFIGTLLGIVLSHSDYVAYCVKTFVKAIMNYIYFPSPVVYFFIVLFMICITVKTMFSNIDKWKRIFNYVVSCIMYFLFFLFIVRVTLYGVVLMDVTNVYSDEVVLSIIQISNSLLVIWILVSGFWKLYNFYKKRFD